MLYSGVCLINMTATQRVIRFSAAFGQEDDQDKGGLLKSNSVFLLYLTLPQKVEVHAQFSKKLISLNCFDLFLLQSCIPPNASAGFR